MDNSPYLVSILYAYRIMGIIHGRKVSRISLIWKHSRMFSCTFYLSWNFYMMRLPESRKFSCELWQRRQFAKLFFRGWLPLYDIKFRGLIFCVFDWQENLWGINFRGHGGEYNCCQICQVCWLLCLWIRSVPQNLRKYIHLENFYAYINPTNFILLLL